MVDEIAVFIPIVALLIPVVAIAGTTVKRWLSFKEKQLEVTAQATAEQAAQYAARIATLEERVAVLNRIVTDRNEGLTAQIEALREPTPGVTPIRTRN